MNEKRTWVVCLSLVCCAWLIYKLSIGRQRPPRMPGALQTEEFVIAWQEWLAYRKTRPPFRQVSKAYRRAELEKLRKLSSESGIALATALVRRSTDLQYAGIVFSPGLISSIQKTI